MNWKDFLKPHEIARMDWLDTVASEAFKEKRRIRDRCSKRVKAYNRKAEGATNETARD